MPSVSGTHVIPARCYHALLREVENGATLFVSSDGGSLEPFSTVFGIDIATRCKAVAETTIRSEEREFDVRCRAEYQLNLVNRRAEVLAVDIDDDPIFTLCGYGRGKALFLAAPIERAATRDAARIFPGGAGALPALRDGGRSRRRNPPRVPHESAPDADRA